MKRLTKFTVIIQSEKGEYAYTVDVGKPRANLAVSLALKDLFKQEQIGYEHIQKIYSTTSTGTPSMIEDVYGWARANKFGELL
jgi:hypothetical protein